MRHPRMTTLRWVIAVAVVASPWWIKPVIEEVASEIRLEVALQSHGAPVTPPPASTPRPSFAPRPDRSADLGSGLIGDFPGPGDPYYEQRGRGFSARTDGR